MSVVTAPESKATVALARRLLPRPCPTCGASCVFPRRYDDGHFVMCDELPNPSGRVTLTMLGDQIRAHVLEPRRADPFCPALRPHQCPDLSGDDPARRAPVGAGGDEWDRS